MKEQFTKLWNEALPYQDFRDDAGHAREVAEYAAVLLQSITAEEAVVIPAAILHDIGWSQMTLEERFIIFSPTLTAEQNAFVRDKHQCIGITLAKQLLERTNYPKQYHQHILEIVSQHDTREGFFSPEDGVMRDADKLWRFSKTGFEADLRRRTESRSYFEKLSECIDKPNFFANDISRSIARRELAARAKEHGLRITATKRTAHKVPHVKDRIPRGAQHSHNSVKGHGKRPMRRY